jgi:hypothetical protein
VHAEVDALNKLKGNRSGKRIGINMVVVRLTKNYVLQTSKPCDQCIKKMREIPERKGYRLMDVYYSDGANKIEKMRLRDLEKEEDKYVTKRNRDKRAGL